MRVVDIVKLRESQLPVDPSEFEVLVRKHCSDAREAFQYRYCDIIHLLCCMLIVSGGCKSVGTYSVRTNHLGVTWCQQVHTTVRHWWSTSSTVPAA